MSRLKTIHDLVEYVEFVQEKTGVCREGMFGPEGVYLQRLNADTVFFLDVRLDESSSSISEMDIHIRSVKLDEDRETIVEHKPLFHPEFFDE